MARRGDSRPEAEVRTPLGDPPSFEPVGSFRYDEAGNLVIDYDEG
jgi:hypothetical protein